MNGIASRPTLYKGIRMRSRLEADYARHLDATGWEWEYEPECFASDGGQWLADFRCRTSKVNPWHYIELKPSSIFNGDAASVIARVNEALRKTEIALASDSGVMVSLVIWEYGSDTPVAMFVPSTVISSSFGHCGWAVHFRNSPTRLATAWTWQP